MPPAQSQSAVLIAGSAADDSARSPQPEETPLHLTPLLGKTPLVFAVQALVELGVKRIVCLGWMNLSAVRPNFKVVNSGVATLNGTPLQVPSTHSNAWLTWPPTMAHLCWPRPVP